MISPRIRLCRDSFVALVLVALFAGILCFGPVCVGVLLAAIRLRSENYGKSFVVNKRQNLGRERLILRAETVGCSSQLDELHGRPLDGI